MRFAILLLLLYAPLSAQNYPQDYFRSPLDIPLQLSGNFGEFRSNHFHAGYDFRTQQKEGFNVYASAEGYVSRIKISAYGYGKAVYITHPNGYTTLYGHLQALTGPVADYLKRKQYEKQQSEIELFPEPNEIPVKKGERIALSGNTGGSGGPHLHFEIRDAKTENIINPALFGFDKLISDSKRPTVTGVMVYPIDDESVANGSAKPTMVALSAQPDGTFLGQRVSANGRIGFGISAYDSESFSSNKNGVYSVTAYFNGTQIYQSKFVTFHFDETRYVNAMLDFGRFKQTGQRYQELFMRKKYDVPVITTDEALGILTIAPQMDGVYRIEVADVYGNKTVVSVPVGYSSAPATTASVVQKTPFFLDSSKDHSYEKDNASVFFPAGTFYDDFYLYFDVQDGELRLGNKDIPAHKSFTVSIKANPADDLEKRQTFIATIDGKGKGFNFTSFRDGAFTAKVKNMANYALARDTTKPVIGIPKSIEGKWISNQRYLVLTIRDDLSGIKEYNGYLNGKWIMFEYDYRTRKIVHDFNDGIVQDGRNDLKVVVTDNVGNTAIFETHFFRSQKR